MNAPDSKWGREGVIVMTATSHQSGSIAAKRTAWRTPTLTEDTIADITMNQALSPGDDGFDKYGAPYDTSGLS